MPRPLLGARSPPTFYLNPALGTSFSNDCSEFTVFECLFVCDSEMWVECGAPTREGSDGAGYLVFIRSDE